MAPLSEDAGGWGQIRPGWKSKDDPVFKKMQALVDKCIIRKPTENTNGWKPTLAQGAGEQFVLKERDAYRKTIGTVADFVPPPPRKAFAKPAKKVTAKPAKPAKKRVDRPKNAKSERMAKQLFEMAKEAEKMGQRDAALKFYQKIIKDFPDSALARSAKAKLTD